MFVEALSAPLDGTQLLCTSMQEPFDSMHEAGSVTPLLSQSDGSNREAACLGIIHRMDINQDTQKTSSFWTLNSFVRGICLTGNFAVTSLWERRIPT